MKYIVCLAALLAVSNSGCSKKDTALELVQAEKAHNAQVKEVGQPVYDGCGMAIRDEIEKTGNFALAQQGSAFCNRAATLAAEESISGKGVCSTSDKQCLALLGCVKVAFVLKGSPDNKDQESQLAAYCTDLYAKNEAEIQKSEDADESK